MAPKIVCVVGPTACGKTALGVLLAKQYGGEVVSADSMQIYKGMTIGTAAPTAAEMDGVPHHMIAVSDPAEQWSAARYAREAAPVIDDILARGKLPVLVGGTGLWIDAVVKGHGFAAGCAGGSVRKELEDRLAAEGVGPLLAELREVDPPTKSGSSGPWRSTGRRGGPSPPTMRRRRPCLPGTTRFGSACSSPTGRT